MTLVEVGSIELHRAVQGYEINPAECRHRSKYVDQQVVHKKWPGLMIKWKLILLINALWTSPDSRLTVLALSKWIPNLILFCQHSLHIFLITLCTVKFRWATLMGTTTFWRTTNKCHLYNDNTKGVDMPMVFLTVMFISLLVLPHRASDFHEAAEQCGGVGRREFGVPLHCSRRPCSHCPLEERWFWPA